MLNTQHSYDEMKTGWSILTAQGAGADAAMLTQEIKSPSNAEDQSAVIQEVEEENNPEEGSPKDQRHSIMENQAIQKEVESAGEEVAVNRSISKHTNEELEKTFQAVIEPSVTLLENQ